MSESTVNRQEPVVDWVGVALALLMFSIMTAAASLAASLPATVANEAQSVGGGAGTGGRLALLLVVESLAFIGAIRLYRRLPEHIRERLSTLAKYGLPVAFAVLFGTVALELGVLYLVILGALKLLKRLDLSWLAHNAVGVTLAVVMTGLLAFIIGPAGVIAFALLAAVWDYAAVDLSDLMGDLLSGAVSLGIPNYLVIPAGLRLDMDTIERWLTDNDMGNKPKGIKAIIGVGDFVIPGMVPVAATLHWAPAPFTVTGFWLPAVALSVAMIVLRAQSRARDDATPGLPVLVPVAVVSVLPAYIGSLGVVG